MVEYDVYYQQEDYYGAPYKDMISFFENIPSKGKLLDLGCGQGRNAIPLAAMGYDVTGVDISRVGINQMIEKARRMNIHLRGIIADAFDFDFDQDYDIVLIDSLLHLKKENREKEIALIKSIADQLNNGGLICICTWESIKTEKLLKKILDDHSVTWEINKNVYLGHISHGNETHEFRYGMSIIKKGTHN